MAIGSVNDDKYLSAEENRRWWPVKIEKFKLDDLKRDVDQLWAEAAHYEALDKEITLKKSFGVSPRKSKTKGKSKIRLLIPCASV